MLTRPLHEGLDSEGTAMRTTWKECLIHAWKMVKAHISLTEAFVIVALITLVCFAVSNPHMFSMLWDATLHECESLGLLATVPIAVLCMACIVAGIPVDFCLLAAGALFDSMYGLYSGAFIAIIACCFGVYIGCIAAFYLGRTILKAKLDNYLQQYEMLRIINKIIESDGWKFAFVLRLSPLMPNEPLNYACAMTSMSFEHNLVATLGSLPKTAYEIWVAAQIHHNAYMASSEDKPGNSGVYAIVVLNLVLLLVMVALLYVAKKKYDTFVEESRHIEPHHKKLMKRASTLRSFDVHAEFHEQQERVFQGLSSVDDQMGA